MRPISDYFSPSAVGAFSRAVPKLRTQLGVVPFSNRSEKFGVAGETFRAYTGWRNPPSSTYRSWASRECDRLNSQLLLPHLNSRNSFLQWHGSMARSLQKHWVGNEGEQLSFAHQYKLIDLYVKWLSRHDFGNPKVSRGFAAYANCALDRQTLGKLNESLSYALPMPKPSMGHILTKETYDFTQEAVSDFASHCGGSPLLFDFYAWRKGG